MLPGEVATSLGIVSVMCTDVDRLDDGDPSITVFARASDALRAAVELQATTAPLPDDRAPATRVAIDTGEVDADNVTTASIVERCRRLLHAGHAGQILTSSTTVEIARPGLDEAIELLDLGTHHVRGLPAPVWIWQVSAAGQARSFPPLSTREAAAALLPVPDTTFIGRDGDLAALANLLDRHRIVTIVGAGGCGKTRFAIEVALEVMGRFRHGICWVDLAPVIDAAAIVDAMAAAVGLHTTADVTVERIAAFIGHRSMLLLVDNCEHVVDDAANLIAVISEACPAIRVVATSREPLALSDEVVWRIPSLDVPHGSDLLEADAGRLLVDRIRRVRPGYEPDDVDRAALAAICRRLDGIPLAVELAAARTRTMSPAELADQLEERFTLLAGGARDAVARQRTLEASVAWSYQLLDADERQAFRRLSAFTGSFPMDAATQLCEHVQEPEPLVTRLRDCSLLVDRPGPGTRMQMLEPVRWFARERLIDSGEAEVVLGLHLDWCLTTAHALGFQLEGPRVQDALVALDADVDNLRAAMEWAVGHGRGLDAARIIAATSWYWVWRGRIVETGRWLQRAAVDDDTLEPADRLAILWARSELIGIRSGIDDVIAEGLAIARAQHDVRTEARLLVSHSRYRAFTDPHETIAQAPYERALCREVGDAFWAATSYVGEALAQISLGRFDLAEPLLDQLRIEARALDHPQLIADEVARRALVDRRFGRYEAVLHAVGEIDRITAGFTTLNSQALVHAQAALVDVAQGRAEAALVAMEMLYRRYVVAGELGYLPSIALPIIDALIDLGRADEALDRFERVWTGIRRTISWRLRMGSVRATALLASGRTDAAWAAFTDVLEEALATPNDHEVAIAERFLGAIDRDAQRFNDAETRLHRALDIQARLGYPQYVADNLEELAGIELDHNRANAAAVLFGAASSIRDRSGVTRRIGRQATYDGDIAELRRRLGDELDEAWQRGAALTIGDAVEFAQRGRGERRRPASGWESLTVTEAKVAALVAEGHTNPEIAEQLVMGRATVKTHVSNILRKLGLTNRTQLARLAARR